MNWFWPFLSKLGSRTLVTLCAVLFAVDLIVPDPLPFVDEILLAVATIMLARRRGRSIINQQSSIHNSP
jgi:hypothetical protein